MEDRIIRVRELEEITGVSERSLRRYEERGDFPRRIKISQRAIGWRMSEVQKWLNERKTTQTLRFEAGL